MVIRSATSEPPASVKLDGHPLPEALESIVLSRWEELGLPPTGGQLEHVLLSRGSALKMVIALADSQTAEYRLIAKLAPSAEGRAVVETEYRHLSSIQRALGPGSPLAASVPRPLCLLRAEHETVALQEAIDGLRLTGLARRNPRGPWLRLGAQWLIDFHRAMASSFEASLLQHGDFALTNLFLRKDGTLGVIDWDFFGSDYPPMFDLFSLLNSWAFSRTTIRSTETNINRCAAMFARTWLSDRWFRNQAATLLGGYCTALGIPRASVRRHFLEHLNRKRERAQRLYRSDHFYPQLFGLIAERARNDWPILADAESWEAVP